MYNYAPIKELAARLIKNFGREITFISLNATPTDPTKPWFVDGITGQTTVKLSAAFVEPDSAQQLGESISVGDLIKRSDKICIVEPGTNDLFDYEEVLDTDGQTYKIEGIELLQPGGTVLLGFVGLKR